MLQRCRPVFEARRPGATSPKLWSCSRRTIAALRQAKDAGEDGVAVVEREIGMEQLDDVLPVISAVADVADQDILVTAAERYSVLLRRFSPRFLAAFDFRAEGRRILFARRWASIAWTMGSPQSVAQAASVPVRLPASEGPTQSSTTVEGSRRHAHGLPRRLAELSGTTYRPEWQTAPSLNGSIPFLSCATWWSSWRRLNYYPESLILRDTTSSVLRGHRRW